MGELTSRHAPATADEVAEIVRDACAAREPIAVEGGATRSGWGRPVQAARTLSAAALTGIVEYEPSEMVVTARAGTPMRELEAEIASKNQRFAFEPMDHRPLFGATDEPTGGEPTIGGVTAANASGPRRIAVGAARDALLGVEFVNGRGEIVRGGGKVMKNVTGLDLPKVLAGSWGTLGVLTQVTFKVAPVPETQSTMRFANLAPGDAVALLAAAMATPCEPTAAAVLPDGTAAIRLEGFATSIRVRIEKLRAALARYGDAEIDDETASTKLWRDVRDVAPFAGSDAPVWRVSLAPSNAPLLLDALRPHGEVEALLDWQGGLAWLRTDLPSATVRREAELQRGHATLARAPAAARAAEPVFPPEPAPLAALSARVRAAFDPAGILNPGRMA